MFPLFGTSKFHINCNVFLYGILMPLLSPSHESHFLVYLYLSSIYGFLNKSNGTEEVICIDCKLFVVLLLFVQELSFG